MKWAAGDDGFSGQSVDCSFVWIPPCSIVFFSFSSSSPSSCLGSVLFVIEIPTPNHFKKLLSVPFFFLFSRVHYTQQRRLKRFIFM